MGSNSTYHAASSDDSLRTAFERSLREGRPSEGELQWRLSRFDRGLRLLQEIENSYGLMTGARIADLGAGYGGDSCALLTAGGAVVAVDYCDYGYARLCRVASSRRLHLNAVIATAETGLPFKSESFDVVLAMNLLEHLPDASCFFREVSRLLRHGGIAIVSVPISWKGLRADPFYGSPLTSLLPMPLRCWAAERLFGRTYPFPLRGHTYYSANPIVKGATRSGLRAEPRKFANSPLLRRVRTWPLCGMWTALVNRYLCDFVILRRSTPSVWK
jgi:SAM-dependent methyltransferase